MFAGDIPVVQSDRGGQITYHGPGQIILYPLIDIKRAHIGLRDLITALEQSVVDWLGHQGVVAYAKRKAPGVYVGAAKISSLGLRVRKGRAYHGIALNLDMDLSPFAQINPCGYQALPMIDAASLGLRINTSSVQSWVQHFMRHLSPWGIRPGSYCPLVHGEFLIFEPHSGSDLMRNDNEKTCARRHGGNIGYGGHRA